MINDDSQELREVEAMSAVHDIYFFLFRKAIGELDLRRETFIAKVTLIHKQLHKILKSYISNKEFCFLHKISNFILYKR